MTNSDHVYEYRADGWPLCPQCGEDELASLVPISISLFPKPDDKMFCYVCRWSGFVPLRELSAGDLV